MTDILVRMLIHLIVIMPIAVLEWYFMQSLWYTAAVYVTSLFFLLLVAVMKRVT